MPLKLCYRCGRHYTTAGFRRHDQKCLARVRGELKTTNHAGYPSNEAKRKRAAILHDKALDM